MGLLSLREGGRRRSSWEYLQTTLALTNLAAAAFRDQPQTRQQWPVARTTCLRLMLLLSLFVSDRRVHPSGQAMCLISGRARRYRVKATVLALSGMALLIGLVVLEPWAFWAIAAMAVVFLGPQLVTSLRAGPSRDRLIRSTPKVDYVGVHTVASGLPGRGRQLMEQVNREADEKRWTLVLDAANDRLRRFYESLGFVAVSTPQRMPWGEAVTRMVRYPTSPAEQEA